MLSVLMVSYPVVVMALRALSKKEMGSALRLEWLSAVFESNRSYEALVNTAIYTAGSSALAMTLGVGLAFLSTRTDMPGGRCIGFLSLLPMLVPPFILVVGWVALADPNAGFINIIASSMLGTHKSWANYV